MSFITFFRSQMPNILATLNTAIQELVGIKSSLERLLITEQNFTADEVLNEDQYSSFIKSAIDSFGVALWIKDASGRFVFANKVCCETILKCTEAEALNMKDTDLKDDALSAICIKSDKVVMANRRTMRFIEHAVYPGGKDVFLDVTKSPRIQENLVVGTIGNAVVITGSIPQEIRRRHKSSSIEIPTSASIGTKKLVELLERRNESKRNEKDDNKFQEWRKKNRLSTVAALAKC